MSSQTSYLGIVPLHRNATYIGGFCRFWYIPVEDCSVFPRINSENQFLIDEPSLVPGKAWFGPIDVPKNKLGFTEVMKKIKAGIYYEQKIEGIHIGDSEISRVNLENMVYHKYLVVAKVRAGGFYNLFGSIDSPMSFNPEYKSGISAGETAETIFSFFTEHISKAYVLPQFTADQLAPGSGGSGGSEDPDCMVNQKEIIPFVNEPLINVPWTPTRLAKFGTFPIVEVWIDDGVNPPFLSMGGSIEVDAAPPAFTELNVNLGGNPSGFIVLT